MATDRLTRPTNVANMDQDTDLRALVYTEQDWDDESYALNAEREDPRKCPGCGLTGFYGPRARDGHPKHRACRFCGFYQEVGRVPIRMRPVVHDCADWPEVAKAPYVWWILPNERWYACPFCDRRAPVEASNAFQRGIGIAPPSDDPNHPWWRVPQDQSYMYYVRFWENWPSTKGRAVF